MDGEFQTVVGKEEDNQGRKKHYPTCRKEEEGKQECRKLLPRTREEEGSIVLDVSSRCWKVMVFFRNNDHNFLVLFLLKS